MKKLIKTPEAPKSVERQFVEINEYIIELMSSIFQHQVLESMNKSTINKFADNKQVGNYAVVFNKLAKQAKRKLLKRFTNARLEKIARQYLEKADNQSRTSLYNQVEKQLSIPATELKLKEKTRTFRNPLILETAQWMKKLRDETLELYTANSLRMMTQGNGIDSILEEFKKLKEKRKNHAKFTARNQINNFNSLMTKARSQELGIKKAIWQTAKDERVRDSHQARDGKEFNLNEGLYSSLDGKTLLPATDYNCRCTYILVFDDESQNQGEN